MRVLKDIKYLMLFLALGLLVNPSNSYAEECYNSAGKRKLPNLRKLNLQSSKRSLKTKGISAEFLISENLEVLKGHFPDYKIFPGVLYAQMAAKLIQRQESVFGEKVYISQVSEFNNKAQGLPGSRVLLEIQLSESKSKQKIWKVKAKNPNNEKVIFSEGQIISQAIPKGFYKTKPNPEADHSTEALYSTAVNLAFLKHEKEIFFPIEVLRYQFPEETTLLKNAGLESLELLNHKVFTRVNIAKSHLLMENIDANNSHLPITNFSELGAQTALLILKPHFSGQLPYEVLLRGVKNVVLNKAIHSQQNYYMESEVIKATYKRRMGILSVDFVVQIFDAQQDLVASANISGVLMPKSEID
ncbi:MAG: hypothetical protein CL674_13495 [Bdellovibrionaceae bacterium]|nr:hypothetical protein [Pseudobdellovibrionaceae bacterium]